jgi:hypothetical protein
VLVLLTLRLGLLSPVVPSCLQFRHRSGIVPTPKHPPSGAEGRAGGAKAVRGIGKFGYSVSGLEEMRWAQR